MVFLAAAAKVWWVVAVAEASVSVKWGQSLREVFVTVSGCEELRSSAVAEDRLSVSCGRDGEVEWRLREDVVASESGCRRSGGVKKVSCRLRKRYDDHAWDRLREDEVSVPIDWSQWPEEEAGSPGDPYEGIETVPLVESWSSPVFADLRMHWCHSCDHVAKSVERAAKELAGVAKFARLDALEHRELARRVGLTCSYNCRLLALPSERWVEARRDLDVGLLRRLASPAWTLLLPEESRKKNRSVVLGAGGDEAAFEAAATALHGADIAFFKDPAATGLTAYDASGEAHECSSEPNATRCASYGTAPLLLVDVDYATEADLRRVVAPQLQVIAPSLDAALEESSKRVARALRGVATVKLRLNDSYAFYDFGVLDETRPIYGLTATDDYAAPKYLFDGDGDLAAWARSLATGAATQRRAYRTASPSSDGEVVTATLDLTKDSVLVVSDAWESSKKKRVSAADLRQLVEPFVEVGEFAVGINEIDASAFGTDKFFGVWLLPEKIKCKKTTAVGCAKWIADVRDTPGILDTIETRAEAKRRAKRLEDELQAKALAAFPEPVADGVSKRVYVVGQGDAIRRGDLASVHYVGVSTATGEVFDSSRKRGREPFSVAVGQGQVIPCWDRALVTMRVGDRVKLDCRADQAYGDDGRLKGDLTFDIEVLSVSAPPPPSGGDL